MCWSWPRQHAARRGIHGFAISRVMGNYARTAVTIGSTPLSVTARRTRTPGHHTWTPHFMDVRRSIRRSPTAAFHRAPIAPTRRRTPARMLAGRRSPNRRRRTASSHPRRYRLHRMRLAPIGMLRRAGPGPPPAQPTRSSLHDPAHSHSRERPGRPCRARHPAPPRRGHRQVDARRSIQAKWLRRIACWRN